MADPNSSFIAKLDGHSTVLKIDISKKAQVIVQSDEDEPSNRRYYRGTTYRRRPIDDILGRRRKGGTIKFYDMGRKWDGSAFVDVDYNEPPILNAIGTPVYGYVEHSNGILEGWQHWTPRIVTYNALRTSIIDYDLGDIETMHPQLYTEDEAYWYTIELLDNDYLGAGTTILRASADDLTNWGIGGWKVDPTYLTLENFAIQQGHYGIDGAFNNRVWHNIYFGGTTRNHFTDTYDADADDLPDFMLQLGDKVFMMPVMAQLGARADYPFTEVRDYLASNHMVIPRSSYLDPLNENYLDGSGDDNPLDPDTYDLKRIRLLQDKGFNILRKKTTFDIDIPGWVWNDSLDPMDYPDPSWDAIQCFWAGDASNESNSFLGGGVPDKALLAIIKRGTNLFYVWK